MQNVSKSKQILLVGNPNVGKSTIFNLLCNRQQKTGNYAGVTVASHSGTYEYQGETVEVIDLPGSYSIYPGSEDEAIFSKFLIDEQQNYAGVVYILEALSIKRGLLLFQQIQDLGIPVLVVVNQIDQAERRGINIDVNALSAELGVRVLQSNAKKNLGIEDIRGAVFNNSFKVSENITFEIPVEQKGLVFKILQETKENNQYRIWTLLASETYLGKLESVHEQLNADEVKCLVPKRLQTQETVRRYQNIDRIIGKVIAKKPQFKELLTEKLDKILVHQFWGYIVFGLVLLMIFQSVFWLAEYPMNWIADAFFWLSTFVGTHMPGGPLNSLIANGIIPGIGGIAMFAPQIGILLYFLYLLEDSGDRKSVV